MKFIYVNTEGRDRYINVDHIVSLVARVDTLNKSIGTIINVRDTSFLVEDTLDEILNKIDLAPNRGQ